jgi:hypothetical protein
MVHFRYSVSICCRICGKYTSIPRNIITWMLRLCSRLFDATHEPLFTSWFPWLHQNGFTCCFDLDEKEFQKEPEIASLHYLTKVCRAPSEQGSVQHLKGEFVMDRSYQRRTAEGQSEWSDNHRNDSVCKQNDNLNRWICRNTRSWSDGCMCWCSFFRLSRRHVRHYVTVCRQTQLNRTG